MDKKCSKCEGDMAMVCTETHDHVKECKMKCNSCGNEETMGSGERQEAPASGEGQMQM